MSLIFDSYAIITLFREEPGYEEVIDWLGKINREQLGYMSVINLGEVYYITSRKQSPQKAAVALEAAMQLPFTFVDADFDLTYRAAKLKASYKLSYADAFAAALTIEKKGLLITGDLEFKNLVKEKDFKVHFIRRKPKG